MNNQVTLVPMIVTEPGQRLAMLYSSMIRHTGTSLIIYKVVDTLVPVQQDMRQ